MEEFTDKVVIVDGEVREDIEPPPVLLHNWMYSIVPGPKFDIFLAGFCKNCKTSFTQKMGTNYLNPIDIKFTKHYGIPKYGCDGPT